MKTPTGPSLCFVIAIAAGLSAAEPAAPAAEMSTPADAAASMGASVRVERLALGTGVSETREIVGEAASFDASVGRIYCWTEIHADTPPASVKHVWYADGKMINDVELSVKNSRHRTWSYKTVWPAEWKVEVTDASGNVLKDATFTVAGASQAMPAGGQPQ